MTDDAGRRSKPKNLVILHLESIAWQMFHGFPEAFPHLERLMADARVFHSHIASATSTQMVMAALLHGNDCEFDAETSLTRPAVNNPSLMTILGEAGHRAEMLCLTASENKRMMPGLIASTGPIWATSDRGELLARFDAGITAQPFAFYVWNLASHIEHAAALLPYTTDLSELLGTAYLAADQLLGSIIDALSRKGVLDDTTLVVIGDHGDDYWSHGFKNGMLHGTEPYNHVVHTPLVIRDGRLPPGDDHRMISTIDLAPTCIDLLRIDATLDFKLSGHSIVARDERRYAFSQNFTATQADMADWDVRKAFSISDRSWTLLVSSLGLEMYNRRIDPGNLCNLLNFFDLDDDALSLRRSDRHNHPHFATTMRAVIGDARLNATFQTLRDALRRHVEAKHDHVRSKNGSSSDCLDPACFDLLNGRHADLFFNGRFGMDAPMPRSAAFAAALRSPITSLARKARHLLSRAYRRFMHSK